MRIVESGVKVLKRLEIFSTSLYMYYEVVLTRRWGYSGGHDGETLFHTFLPVCFFFFTSTRTKTHMHAIQWVQKNKKICHCSQIMNSVL